MSLLFWCQSPWCLWGSRMKSIWLTHCKTFTLSLWVRNTGTSACVRELRKFGARSLPIWTEEQHQKSACGLPAQAARKTWNVPLPPQMAHSWFSPTLVTATSMLYIASSKKSKEHWLGLIDIRCPGVVPVWDPFCRFANRRLARVARLEDTIHQQASNNARNKAWELDIWIFFGRLLCSTTLGRCRRSHEAPTSLPDGKRSMLSHLVGDAFSKQQLRSMQTAADEIKRSWLSISPIANCQASAPPFRHMYCLSPERVVPFEVDRANVHDTWQGKHDHEFGVRLARHALAGFSDWYFLSKPKVWDSDL